MGQYAWQLLWRKGTVRACFRKTESIVGSQDDVRSRIEIRIEEMDGMDVLGVGRWKRTFNCELIATDRTGWSPTASVWQTYKVPDDRLPRHIVDALMRTAAELAEVLPVEED